MEDQSPPQVIYISRKTLHLVAGGVLMFVGLLGSSSGIAKWMNDSALQAKRAQATQQSVLLGQSIAGGQSAAHELLAKSGCTIMVVAGTNVQAAAPPLGSRVMIGGTGVGAGGSMAACGAEGVSLLAPQGDGVSVVQSVLPLSTTDVAIVRKAYEAGRATAAPSLFQSSDPTPASGSNPLASSTSKQFGAP
jgi:hypothetical protein